MRGFLTRVLGIGCVVSVLSAGMASAQDVVVLESRPLEITQETVFPMPMTTLSLSRQTMSEHGIEVLKVLESFSPKAYRDGKGYSIGYGFQTWQGRRVTRKYPGRVTIKDALNELYRQLPVYEQIVREVIWFDLPQETFDAFVSIAFNLGRVNDSILIKLNKEQPLTVRDFLTTARYKGRIDWRLQARRSREFLMALGDYDSAKNIPGSRRQVQLSLRDLGRVNLHLFED